MSALSENMNVWATCLRILRQQGFELALYNEDSEADLHSCFWVAKKGDYDLYAADPIQLLGLARIYEHHSPKEDPKPYWWVVKGPDILNEIFEDMWPDDDDDSYLKLRHCCERMERQLTQQCAGHDEARECGDVVIRYSERFDEYGIPYGDGGTSVQTIDCCPWCGSPLPKSKRDAWFQQLLELGYDDPANQEIPDRFHSDAWRREEPETREQDRFRP